jgi:TrmH family RNA methyltransferase
VKLRERKFRDQKQKFIVEGYHLVNEARTSNYLKQVLITDEKDCIDEVENIMVSEAIIKKLASTLTPQPIIGICDFFPDYEISGNRILLLDDLQDPGNLGTLVRSSLGFGIDLLVLGLNSVDIYNDKFLRATQGAIFKTRIIKKDLLKTIEILKQKRLIIVGTSLTGRPLRKLSRLDKYALILGNEGRGIREEILKITDMNVYVETSPKLESLNVAVAGSIIMHHLD